jgi:pimeloyl-ACP methyl ester carboxylesterase
MKVSPSPSPIAEPARSRFELIANCGHMPQFEQPARLLELVRAFDATSAV